MYGETTVKYIANHNSTRGIQKDSLGNQGDFLTSFPGAKEKLLIPQNEINYPRQWYKSKY